MVRRCWLLLACLAISSLLAMTTAHACDGGVELGVACAQACDSGEDRDADDDAEPAFSHHHGCHTPSGFVPAASRLRAESGAALAPNNPDHPRLAPRDVEPALRPPTA